MSAVGASIIFDAAMERLSRGERFNLGLATGNTMIELYDQLAATFNLARADLSLLSTWTLDEYSADGKCAVSHDHPLSYWKYMHEKLEVETSGRRNRGVVGFGRRGVGEVRVLLAEA